jgi:hypothetical protein
MSPSFDNDLRFRTIPEPLSIQAFVSELAVETFVRPILPRLARFDESRLHTTVREPLFDSRRHELRAIIAPDVGWMPTPAHQS